MRTALFAAGFGWAFVVSSAIADTRRVLVATPGSQRGYAEVEALGDDLFHVELSLNGTLPAPSGALIETTPYVAQKVFPGPTQFASSAGSGVLETADFRLEILQGPDQAPCVSFREKISGVLLSTVCAEPAPGTLPAMAAPAAGLSIAKLGMKNAYGLGEQFRTPGEPNGDWAGSVRSSPNGLGNTLEAFQGGAVGNALFPVLYALGEGTAGYAIYVDDVEAQTWDLSQDPWHVRIGTDGLRDAVRFYLIGGADLPSLRHRFMDLTGHPPVPPKKAFGFWLSEFGYRNWGEINDKLKTLRQNAFPIDGFVLDAFWSGSFATADPHNHIGLMKFDTKNFPDPQKHIASLRDDEGLGIMLHEDPFINDWLDGFQDMSPRGGLVHQCEGCAPRVLDNYLGKIGIIDWSNQQTAAYWHQSRRVPLMDMGVDFHWIDFAELDGYDGDDWYLGIAPLGHAARENHNLFSFAWAKSIADGYTEGAPRRSLMRPFILARSGTAGIQRFGTAFWSGDIGSNLNSLAAHLNAQLQLSLSGLDYFGSDVGGYHREALQGDLNDVYTKWFAHSAAFDVPLRPHTNNWDKTQQTAPDRIGDLASNLANLRLRYELSPYYYSLAHLAHLGGNPVFPPLVYYFQDDLRVRALGDEKMIGPSILVAAGPSNGPVVRDVYLPKGDWVDYRTGKLFASTGQTYSFDFQSTGHFELPHLVRPGAILPTLWVDEQTMNVLGRRRDGTVITDLNLRVYPSTSATHFTVFEDDGETIAYRDGAVAQTLVSQSARAGEVAIDVSPTQGTYAGAPLARRVVARVILADVTTSPSAVRLNGQALAAFSAREAFERADSGWFWDPSQRTVIVRTPSLAVTQAKDVRIVLSSPRPGRDLRE